jgi:hypothetical protein
MSAAPPVSVRSRPAPRAEPPYDDEMPGPAAPGAVAGGHVQGALALALEAAPGPRTPVTSPLRLVPPLVAEPPASRPARPETEEGPERTPRSELPHPGPWAARLAVALLEVLAGERPASQVMRHVSAGIYADLTRTPRRRRASAGRAKALQVHTVRVCEPDDGVAEVSAVLSRGGRRRAVALRLEGQHGRWRCTALQVG